MNKNPSRPKDMNKIISECFNQKEQQHKKAEKEILKMVFGQ